MAKIMCAVCGNKTGMFSRMALKNGEILCKECASRIPLVHQGFACENWSLDDYSEFLYYKYEIAPKLDEIFRVTTQYFDLLIDEEHSLFRLRNGMVYRFMDLEDFDLDFIADEIKEGFISDKAIGEVTFTYSMAKPFVSEQRVLGHERAKAEKVGIFGHKYRYGLPDDMAHAKAVFTALTARCIDVAESKNIELQRALSLLMFDSILEVTPEKLREKRNFLIRAYNSADAAGSNSYTLKINAACDVISRAIHAA